MSISWPWERVSRTGTQACVILVCLLAWLGASSGLAQEVGATYTLYQAELTGLSEPGGVAIARSGRIFVADSGNHRIRVFDSTGESVASFGGRGEDPGMLLFPRDVCISGSGEVVVADTGNHRVQVFSVEGELLRGWGKRGESSGEFCLPTGVATSGDRILVADEANHRIQVFDSQGVFLSTVGEGRLRSPSKLSVSDDGRIYVSDRFLDRILTFSAEGAFFGTWGRFGEYPGFLAHPEGLAVNQGSIYVADTENHRIQIFSPSGKWQGQWGKHTILPHEGEGKIHYPSAIAFSPSGEMAVVCETFEDRCQVFKRDPKPVPMVKDPRLSSVRASAHFGERADASGDLLAITETESHAVQIFDMRREGNPIRITRVGRRGPRFSELLTPGDVKIDAEENRLYVADLGTGKIQIFALDRDPEAKLKYDPTMGRFVKGVDLNERIQYDPRLAGPHPLVPTALELDSSGNIYVLDGPNARVLVLDSKFDLVRSFGRFGTGDGEMRGPIDFAFGPKEKVLYVVDRLNSRIQAFSPDGKFLFLFGKGGAGDDEFADPFSLIADESGGVFVSDSGRHRVLKFDERGRFLLAWGEKGIGASQFFKPKALCHDPRKRIVVIDYGHHRAQVFSLAGEYVHVFGSRFYILPAKESLKDPEEES